MADRNVYMVDVSAVRPFGKNGLNVALHYESGGRVVHFIPDNLLAKLVREISAENRKEETNVAN